MHIAHYAYRPLQPGGIATYIRRLATAQQKRGHDILLLGLDDSSDERAPDASPAFDLQILSSPAEISSVVRSHGVDVLHLHRPVPDPPIEDTTTVRTMHGNQGSCPSGSRFLSRSGTPCTREYSAVGCLWGHLVDHCGSRRPRRIAANFANLHHEQQLAATLPTMTVSQFVRDMMIRSGCPSDNLYVVHSPSPDVSGPYVPIPSDEPPRFVFAGRIEENKGVDWFLRALAQAPPTVHADIAGTGSPDFVDDMHELCDELGLSDRITFHGWLAEAGVYALYRRARAIVVPSVWQEPAGLVTLEAAAHGRPVIASRVGGIPEYADPKFALRVDPHDLDGLVEHISHLAQNYDVAEQMGRNGLAVTRTRFRLDTFVDRVEDVYSLALEDATSQTTAPDDPPTSGNTEPAHTSSA